jgi:hypothetical protein
VHTASHGSFDSKIASLELLALYRAGNNEKASVHLKKALEFKNNFPGRDEAAKVMASMR